MPSCIAHKHLQLRPSHILMCKTHAAHNIGCVAVVVVYCRFFYCTREAKKVEHPLLTVSSQQARVIIADRAERLLRPAATDQTRENDEEISCTPAFWSSSLAKQAYGREEGVVRRDEGWSCMKAEEDELLLLLGEEGQSDGEKERDAAARREESDAASDEDEQGSVLERGDVLGGSFLCGLPQTTALPANAEHTVGNDSEGLAKGLKGGSLKTSFVEELQGLCYPTLWQLGACELTTGAMADFYVPSLSSALEPSKVHRCKWCRGNGSYDPPLF